MPTVSREHVRPLPGISDADVLVRLDTDSGRLVGYAVVLRVFEAGTFRPVRLYDYVPAHGEHHMHRYTGQGIKQQPPEVLAYADIQEGFDAAVQNIQDAAEDMIESWRRQRENQ